MSAATPWGAVFRARLEAAIRTNLRGLGYGG